jgi:hypothetical protein
MGIKEGDPNTILPTDALDNAIASGLVEPTRKHSEAGGWVSVPCWGLVLSPTGEVRKIEDLTPIELSKLLCPD